jgi:enoyl-CoA hydratase/carnithine racemase
MSEFVTVEVRGAVGIITLNRPPLNILNLQVQDELALAAAAVEGDGNLRSAIIYGGEKTFAAGADVKEMNSMSAPALAGRPNGLQHGFLELSQLSKPVVAAISGYALGGGCELALCADVRIAASDAVLGQPEVLLGIMPGCGGTQRLSRLVGPARAKDLMLTGRKVAVDEAYRIGLVDRVVPAGTVLNEALAWASQFAGGPALALATIKAAVDGGLNEPLDRSLALERALFERVFASEDKTIGMTHFLTKKAGAAPFVGA